MTFPEDLCDLERLNYLMEQNEEEKLKREERKREVGKKDYYLYVCIVDGTLRYVGKGRNNRWKHCVSGTSSCAYLNRDFFLGKTLEVWVSEYLPEKIALSTEANLLVSNRLQIYNKSIPKNGTLIDFRRVCTEKVYEDNYNPPCNQS
jgi:hypothetical protein